MPVYTDETLPEGITPAMVKRFERVDRLLKRYTETRAKLGDKIKAAFGPGTHVYGNIVVKRNTANVLDSARFQEHYPADQFPQFYRLTLDVKSVPDDVKADFLVEQERASVTAA